MIAKHKNICTKKTVAINGAVLEALIKKKGLTKAKLARRMCMQTSSFSQWCKEQQRPTEENFNLLLGHLELTLEEIEGLMKK